MENNAARKCSSHIVFTLHGTSINYSILWGSWKHINFHFVLISREAKARGLFPLKNYCCIIFSLYAHTIFFCYEHIACNLFSSPPQPPHRTVKWYTLQLFSLFAASFLLKMRKLKIYAYITNVYAGFVLQFYALLTHIFDFAFMLLHNTLY